MGQARFLRGDGVPVHLLVGGRDMTEVKTLRRRLRNSGISFSGLCRLLLILGVQKAQELLAAGVPLREWVPEVQQVSASPSSSQLSSASSDSSTP